MFSYPSYFLSILTIIIAHAIGLPSYPSVFVILVLLFPYNKQRRYVVKNYTFQNVVYFHDSWQLCLSVGGSYILYGKAEYLPSVREYSYLYVVSHALFFTMAYQLFLINYWKQSPITAILTNTVIETTLSIIFILPFLHPGIVIIFLRSLIANMGAYNNEIPKTIASSVLTTTVLFAYSNLIKRE